MDYLSRKDPKKVKKTIKLYDDQVAYIDNIIAFFEEEHPDENITEDYLYQNLVQYAIDRKSVPHWVQLLKDVKAWNKKKSTQEASQEAADTSTDQEDEMSIPALHDDKNGGEPQAAKRSIIEQEKQRQAQKNAEKAS